MPLCIRTNKKFGEIIRKALISKKLLDFSFLPYKDNEYIWFPLIKEPSKKQKEQLEKICAFVIEDKVLSPSEYRPKSFKEILREKLTEKEAEQLVTSFDVIGDIAVIEIPKELENKKQFVGEAILEVHPHIKTVARICGEHTGDFRLRPIEIIAGEKRTLTLHKESGCLFKVDVANTYFSPRLSFERMRIARLIKPNEIIGAWFAGVGPFPIVFAKHTKMKYAIAIELNPKAYSLLVENIKINKSENRIRPLLGDVRKIVPKLNEKFDRIVMPMPKGAEDFLDEVFASANNGCKVHFYRFADTKNPFLDSEKKISTAAAKNKRFVVFSDKRIVRSVSASKVQIVIDFEVR
ncbi:MAG: class I SAM-dependent methyltransferase family protein [Candidatus Diapherotrites archaeon]|nr:class I SAM-dependent methyltransferase family protein [Candidatus Diapherotrites archaeon]